MRILVFQIWPPEAPATSKDAKGQRLIRSANPEVPPTLIGYDRRVTLNGGDGKLARSEPLVGCGARVAR